MCAAQTFIPSGQTSLVKTDTGSYQIQTEYSYRPYPKVKTTIFASGQVLHKIEKKFSKPIDSVEEQRRIEDIIKNQHREVILTIKAHKEKPADAQSGNPDNEEVLSPVVAHEKLSIREQLEMVNGVRQVFCLTKEGEFLGSDSAEQFKRSFNAVFKKIDELLQIFTLLPGSSNEYETGVCEIERNRLYLASAGKGLYIITTDLSGSSIDFEKSIKEIVAPSLFPKTEYNETT